MWPDAFFILNDLSDLMLEQAAKKTENSIFLLGDIERCRLPLVDIITANLSLQWVGDLPLTLKRLIESCDILIFSTLLQGSFYTWKKRLAVHGIYHATHPYPNSYALRRDLYALGRLFFNSKTFSLAFPSPCHALQHLKKTGVCVPHGHVPAAKFVRFLKMDKRPIILEYFVGFVVVIKDSCASLLLESIQM